MKCPFCGYENIEGTDNCRNCHEDLTAVRKKTSTDPLDKSIRHDPISVFTLTPPIIFGPDASIESVGQEISKHLKSALIVENGKLVGIVTKRDFLFKVLGKISDIKNTPISMVMTQNPEVLKSTDKIATALNKMALRGYRHIPVMDNGTPLGVISVRDIIDYLAKMYPNVVGRRQ